MQDVACNMQCRLCAVHWVETTGCKMQRARLQGEECNGKKAEGRMQGALGSRQCVNAQSAVRRMCVNTFILSKSPSLPQV